MAYAIFDIESCVDKRLIRETLYRGVKQYEEPYLPGQPLRPSTEDLTDEQAYRRHVAELREKGGSDFVSLPFHVPVSIAVGVVDGTHRLVALQSLGADAPAADRERAMVADFWRRVEAAKGICLVSFNGRSFDLPVLELQALRWGLSMPKYFGAKYGARYRYQTDAHLDLLDFLTNAGAARGIRGGLDVCLRLCGYAGKGDTSGGDVQELWESGRLDEIDAYCRGDVVRTYALFLRVQVMRGFLPLAQADELAKRALAELEERTAA